jgi:hypothetical protein
MADVGIIEGEKLLILIGNGATTEVFTHPCLINMARSLSFVTNMTETEVPDCDNPSEPAKIVRKAKSIDFTISGTGKVDKTSVFAYIEWLQSAAPKNAKIRQNETGANGGWEGTGKLLLKDFDVSGDRGDYQEVTLTLVPASTFTWTANP